MVRRHEIQVLRRAGHSLVETAQQVGVSQSSVQRVEAEPAVESLDTAAERARRKVGRPSKSEAFRAFLVAELAKQPDVMVLELLRRARGQSYQGGKSALYALVKELRPERTHGVASFTTTTSRRPSSIASSNAAGYSSSMARRCGPSTLVLTPPPTPRQGPRTWSEFPERTRQSFRNPQ